MTLEDSQFYCRHDRGAFTVSYSFRRNMRDETPVRSGVLKNLDGTIALFETLADAERERRKLQQRLADAVYSFTFVNKAVN